MLFRRIDFQRRVGWHELGAALADDFILGQKLAPVRLGKTTLETVPASRTWSAATAHDLRWAKTIRWNRPIGMFARVATMPVFGWLAAVAFEPDQAWAWLGLAGIVQAEACFALAIGYRAGCRGIVRSLIACELWPFWRAFFWLLAWLPLRVSLNGRMWCEAAQEVNSVEESRMRTN